MALLDRLKRRLHQGECRSTVTSLTGEKQSGESNVDDVSQAATEKELKDELVSGLATREYDLYLLLLEGYTPKECAKMLGIKRSMAETGMLEIFRKLRVHTRAELIINYRGINGMKEGSN